MTAVLDEDTVLTQLFVLRLWRKRAGTRWREATHTEAPVNKRPSPIRRHTR